MRKRWKVAAIAAAGLMVFGVLALRFGGEILRPFLSSSSAPPDSQAVSQLLPGDSTPATPADTSGLTIRWGPFVVQGMAYTIQAQRDTGELKGQRAVRRVQVFDSTGRVVYDENLYLRIDSASASDYLEFYPSILEDDAGRPRAFDFSYGWFPSAERSGVAFHVVAPRGDSLVVLTPTTIGYYGTMTGLPAGSAPTSGRLLPGNRVIIESGRGWFDALVYLRLNFECAPRGADCVRIDLRDSIAGLARFQVKVSAREKVDTAVTLDLYSTPHGNSETVTVPAGQEVEILSGAGKVFFDRTPSLYLSGDDDWLEVRVGNKRGWISGQQAFLAIGLVQVG